MTIASQIAKLDSNIAECLELMEASYLNFNLSESEVMEDVTYYQEMIDAYRSQKRGLEIWL